MFRLAHLSDVHLAPLPHVRPTQLFNKRFIGFLSWHLRRRKVHSPHVAAQVVSDIKLAKPDHVALTGDLINIALPQEFTRAATWLEQLGAPDYVSFVPGNHDAYVAVPAEAGLDLWQAYMTGDLQLPQCGGNRFPYIRQRRNIALVGVSTGVPAALHRASGTLGETQIRALAAMLRILRERGFFRVVMIHHPPLPGQTIDRKALTDAAILKTALQTEGAELVLFGHNHVHMRDTLETETGPCHLIGIPSASAVASEHKPAAAWYLYSIERRDKRWQIEVEVRNYHGATDTIVPETPFNLDCG